MLTSILANDANVNSNNVNNAASILSQMENLNNFYFQNQSKKDT